MAPLQGKCKVVRNEIHSYIATMNDTNLKDNLNVGLNFEPSTEKRKFIIRTLLQHLKISSMVKFGGRML